MKLEDLLAAIKAFAQEHYQRMPAKVRITLDDRTKIDLCFNTKTRDAKEIIAQEQQMLDGPKPYERFISTEAASQWLGCDPDEFAGIMRTYLPKFGKLYNKKWLWMDIALLAYALGRANHFPSKRDTPPKPLPPEMPLPAGLLQIKAELVTEYHGPSVYFLILENVVVYVGSSVKPLSRIAQHAAGNRKTEPKVFDYFVILPVTLDNMLATERNFVAILDPEYNRNLKLGSLPRMAPLKGDA